MVGVYVALGVGVHVVCRFVPTTKHGVIVAVSVGVAVWVGVAVSVVSVDLVGVTDSVASDLVAVGVRSSGVSVKPTVGVVEGCRVGGGTEGSLTHKSGS